jgi:hypothetical protein
VEDSAGKKKGTDKQTSPTQIATLNVIDPDIANQ